MDNLYFSRLLFQFLVLYRPQSLILRNISFKLPPGRKEELVEELISDFLVLFFLDAVHHLFFFFLLLLENLVVLLSEVLSQSSQLLLIQSSLRSGSPLELADGFDAFHFAQELSLDVEEPNQFGIRVSFFFGQAHHCEEPSKPVPDSFYLVFFGIELGCFLEFILFVRSLEVGNLASLGLLLGLLHLVLDVFFGDHEDRSCLELAFLLENAEDSVAACPLEGLYPLRRNTTDLLHCEPVRVSIHEVNQNLVLP